MPDDPTKKAPLRPKAAPLGGRSGTLGGPRAVPGPTIREMGGTLPCGCKVAPDPEDNKLRYWFCPPHAVAYEMLDVIQEMQPILDDLVNRAPEDYDSSAAMEAAIKARKVMKKAKGDWR